VDKTVRLWQPSIGRLVRFARLPVEPTSIAWSRDGERLAVGGADGKLRIINPNNVEIEQTFDAIDGWIFEIASASDGSFAVGGTAGVIKRVIPTVER
jgi:WD40 repeat protein